MGIRIRNTGDKMVAGSEECFSHALSEEKI